MTYKKKLIEVALPLDAINKESGREKNIRLGHPFTIHHWWARRPLVSARAVLWASLIDDPSGHPELFPTEAEQDRERGRLFELLQRLATWDDSDNGALLREARSELTNSSHGPLPTVVDPFCGFGTIPIEAQRLGLKTVAGDLNPVAVLISKAMVEVAPRFDGTPPVNPDARARSALQTTRGAQGLAADVEFYGRWIRDQAFERIGHLYPKVELPASEGGGKANPIAWIWARTVLSPDPSWTGHVPLVKSWVLKKPQSGAPLVWITPRVDPDNRKIEFDVTTKGRVPDATIKRAKGVCLATGSPIGDAYIKAQGAAGLIERQLMAVAVEGPRGRTYISPSAAGLPPVPPVPADVPALTLSTHSQYMGPPLYGYTEVADLFTPRQLVTLVTFADLVNEVRSLIENAAITAGLTNDGEALRHGGQGARAYAEAIAMFLAFAVDKLADLGNAFCGWEPIAQCPRHMFTRQAMPMIWDFAEANPFSSSSGSWAVIIDGIVRSFASPAFPTAMASGQVSQIDAAALLSNVDNILLCTDPPYYDNVPYADLSDFFYVWLRRSLKDTWPDILSTLAAPKSEEMVADHRRHGTKERADEFFKERMRVFFRAARGVQSPEHPLTVYYAFRQSEKLEEGVLSTGWQSFLQGILDAGLAVVSTWPVRTESAGRMRAHGSSALASSIVLACRPRADHAAMATRSEFLASLRTELPAAILLLQKQSIVPVDMAQSSIGPGMAVFSRYSRVIETDGSSMPVRQALMLINEVLQEVLSAEETEFDGDTRWALTWFEQHGLSPGPFGDAETLSKAKNTSVDGVIKAGIAARHDGKVRLIGRSELNADWDPTADARLTVWEVTQHLISRLDGSESAAADLLRQIGPGISERARQLAYLLFQAAERRGWTEEAVAHNTLIQAWPDLVKLAGRSESPVQRTLGE